MTSTAHSTSNYIKVFYILLVLTVIEVAIVGGLIFTYRRALKKREKAETMEPIRQLAWNQEESGK